MFSSIYSAAITPVQFFIMAGAAIITGLIYAWLMSFRIKSTKRFFVVVAVLPFIVGAVITFVNGSIGAGVAVGGAFGLIRFRSAPLLVASLGIFEHRTLVADQMLRITIPESLEYNGTFDEIFGRYLHKAESIGVKTTGMGSMFRLSYKIQMKDPQDGKAFIDELRTKNGNLEIAILPFSEGDKQL